MKFIEDFKEHSLFTKLINNFDMFNEQVYFDQNEIVLNSDTKIESLGQMRIWQAVALFLLITLFISKFSNYKTI